MSKTIVKIAKASPPKLFLIADNAAIFSFDNSSIEQKDLVEFDPRYKLDDDQWFTVDQATDYAKCPQLKKLLGEFQSTEYSYIPRNKYEKIQYLCEIGTDVLNFQLVPQRSLGPRKVFWNTKESFELKDGAVILNINEEPHLSFRKSDKKVFFRDFSKAAKIFTGLLDLYREATDTETTDFLNNDFIELEENFESSKVSRSLRSKIALLLDGCQNDGVSIKTRATLLSEKDFSDEFDKLRYDTTSKRFIIRDAESLKLLIHGLNQEFWRDDITNEVKVSSSTRVVETTGNKQTAGAVDSRNAASDAELQPEE